MQATKLVNFSQDSDWDPRAIIEASLV